jgi:mRNA interferase HigB
VQFATIHTDSETALDTWYRTAKTADWQNLVELRESYPTADLVGLYQKAAVKPCAFRPGISGDGISDSSRAT